jgi:thiol-disulfide isomerase/thioredoxin
MARPLSIAIIGAGMGGLASAAALRRAGIAVTVYEQAPQFTRLGAGIQIGCNAMKVLRELGLEAKLRGQSFYPRSWNNKVWRTGEVKFDMVFGEAAEQKFGAPYLLAHRGDLHAALAGAVPEECIRLGHRLVGLDQTSDGVRLSFAGGATAMADAVIGADGVHSVVKDILFAASPLNFTGRIAYRTTFPAALLNGHTIDDCTKWWGEDRHIVIYYVKPDRSEVYFVTSQPEPDFRIESWSAKGDVRELRKAFEGFDRQVENVLAAWAGQGDASPAESPLASLAGATEWLNSKPLTAEDLKGKVVLVDFWTYSCINCLRSIPYVRAWAEKYRDHGLVVIGVHAPEFAFERNVDNVKKAIATLKVPYPVAIDNEYMIWRAFENEYWPAHYFIDAKGQLRHQHFGEGDYDESEHVLQKLLAEAGDSKVPTDIVAVNASGAEAASVKANVESPETYLGYNRIDHFISPGGVVQDESHVYAAGSPQLNEWSLAGNWTIGNERALLSEKDGSIVYRFHARDVHLVLGPAADGSPVRFRVTIDGAAPGAAHGTDVDADGQGLVTAQRLYQLVRDGGTIVDRTFEIHFLDPGVQAYAFTFG